MSGLGLKVILKNVTATLGRQVISGILQLVTLAIIARTFGPSGNGAYTLALLLPTMLATFLNLGVGPANVYFLGANKVNARHAWRVTFRISLWLILLGWAIGAATIHFKSESFFPGVQQNMLWLSLAFFPLVLITGNISSFFQGLQQFKQFNIILLLQPVINLISVGALLIVGINELIYILIIYFISLLITQMVAYRLLKKSINNDLNDILPSYGKTVLNYGYKAHFSNILAFINYRADMFILGYFLGPVPVGIYVIAVNIAEKLWLFSGAVSTVILPKLSELSNDEEKRKELTPLIARWVLWLTLLAAAILAIIGSYVIDIVFGEQYEEAYSAILLLLPGIVLGACSRVLANDMAARGRPDLNLATSWIAVTINIIGNIVLIPSIGLQGAAIATSFAYTINFIMRITMHNYFTGVAFYKNIIMGHADYTLVKSFIHKNN